MNIHIYAALCLIILTGCAGHNHPSALVNTAIRKDPIPDFPETGWIGYSICYSGYREGQDPHGNHPSREEVREDLHILAQEWTFLRTYAASQHARDILEVIREDQLPIRILLGAWLATEDPHHWDYDPKNPALNEAEIEAAAALANAFPDVVVAVNVGNEIMVDWSFQPVSPKRVIELVERTKEQVSVPVTVADNYRAWTTPEGLAVSRVVDFVILHTYPLWQGKTVDQALAISIADYEAVRRAVGPDKRIIIGEAGWATFTPDSPEFHAPEAGSPENRRSIFANFTSGPSGQASPYSGLRRSMSPGNPRGPNNTSVFTMWTVSQRRRWPRPGNKIAPDCTFLLPYMQNYAFMA